MKIAAVVLGILNLAAYILFAVDKRRARHHAWRIPESRLLLICAAGGAPAGLLAMWTLRHKTKHLKFVVGVPLILAVQLILIYMAWPQIQSILSYIQVLGSGMSV